MTKKTRPGNGSKMRNRVASNPLLGKSGRHEKTRKAIRRKDKVKLSTMRFERAAVVASGQSRIVSFDDARIGKAIESTAVYKLAA